MLSQFLWHSFLKLWQSCDNVPSYSEQACQNNEENNEYVGLDWFQSNNFSDALKTGGVIWKNAVEKFGQNKLLFSPWCSSQFSNFYAF